MPTSADNQTIFWEIQLSIAKAVASLEKPSLARLHHDIVEEIGQRPSKKLVDYFLEIAKIPNEEKEEYFRYIGRLEPKKNEAEPTPEKSERSSSAQRLADTIVCSDTPTVLNFRQAHIKEYGEPPSMELVEYFLNKLPDPSRIQSDKSGPERWLAFAEKIAADPNATVLRFRESFTEKFGMPPSSELTQNFLKKLQKNSSTSNKTVASDPESKIRFAKDAGKRGITTILQLRKEYENVYNEAPDSELIDLFIENLPKRERG